MLELLDFAVAIPALTLWTAGGPVPAVPDRISRGLSRPSVVEPFVRIPPGEGGIRCRVVMDYDAAASADAAGRYMRRFG